MAIIILRLFLCVFGIVVPMGSAVAARNFIVIYMDDQRMGTTWAMPNVTRLAAEGVTFSKAYITSPLCTPSRTSLLSGGFYTKSTGILANGNLNGWTKDPDLAKLPIALQRAGYRTAMMGKYGRGTGTRIPLGWTWFRAIYGADLSHYYLDATVVESVVPSTPDKPGVGAIRRGIPYTTKYLADEAVAFLDTVASEPDKPFFLYWAPPAMHAPADTDPSGLDDRHFAAYQYRGRSYGETDFSDKPAWVTDPARDFIESPETDDFHRDQLRTLRAADRAIGAILKKLQDIGKANETLVIFTSDNGYMWGEHGIYGKGNAYEESINVPMIVRPPDWLVAGPVPRRERRLVAVNLDIPATVLELSGAKLDDLSPGVRRRTEGQSIAPLLTLAPTTGRNEIFLEGYGERGDGSYGSWGALISRGWKYIAHRSGAEELYNRAADPLELENRVEDSALANVRGTFAARLAALKGLTFRKSGTKYRDAFVGRAYRFDPGIWGGKPPYRVRVSSGTLPPGLVLDPISGLISGVPTAAGISTFYLEVTDASRSPFHGGPQTWVSGFTVVVR